MPAKNHFQPAVLAAWLALAACLLLPTGGAQAQSAAEHASHHPGTAPAAGTMAGGAPAREMAGMGASAGGGGMMEEMGEMMKNMGKPPPKEFYPSLMVLPELTPEKRLEVEQQSSARMRAGTMLMSQALEALDVGAQTDNYAAMHEATRLLREGVAQFDSGIAARRALAEGRAPREVALTWFKRELSLASPVARAESPSGRGLSVLHLFTMVLLVGFAVAMFAMYFFKMRRAAALFGRIEPDKKSPPPGSSPPLEGGNSPPAAKPGADKAPKPTDDKAAKPATGEKPAPPTSPDKSPKPPEPSAEKPASPALHDKSPTPAEPPAEKPSAPAPPPKSS